ncbi:WD domain protein [Cordyceps fumosorosea ARSEF 2679]|uniref:WD domain protein n=1 Tax=Cordyceps fumosorosea (strain ARSEF 2679) TaxID=1081104 RepID=A0A167V680_CORFA|nr:WD domain protein [Cordyceps fumosorosea ARSEF 2679]OAA62270.1 WD domain protein [Cordyceps fumosorosea ARSEF 2679]
MYNLANVESHRFGGRQEEPAVYITEIARTGLGLAAIATDNAISLLDPARLAAGPVAAWHAPHGESVTALRTLDDALVCTAGEDGTVAVWDLRIKDAAAKVAHFKASEAPILSMACSRATNTIAVGTELHNHTASIHLWDVTGAPAPRAHYQDVHSDDVTELAFHGGQPALLLSGSTDGLVSVHDTRVADEDEVTVQTFNHGASVHRAAFLGPASSEVLALSHDERFALYDAAEERAGGDAIRDFGDLRPLLGCQYVANVTPKADGLGAVIGAGAQEYV